jgi:hypothetical protein
MPHSALATANGVAGDTSVRLTFHRCGSARPLPSVCLAPKVIRDLSAAAAGKKYRETFSVPLRGKRSVTIRVTDATAPRRLVTEGDLRPLLPRMEMELVDAGQNTFEVRWRMLSRNENRLAGCTVLPVAGWVMRRRAKIGLLNLKLLLEGGRRDVTVPQAITSQWRYLDG